MAANPYFLYPFAESGTVTPISNTGSSTGTVNYPYGFTSNYELDLSGGAPALPIPRGQFNQLMLDITTALQNLQTYGASPWVAPATGSPPVGGPASYPLYARVFYAPASGAYSGVYLLWESQVAANTSVPGADSNWIPVSQSMVQVGTVQWFAGPNGLTGSLKCDGTAVPRTTYPALYDALTVTQTASTTNASTTLTVTSTANLSAGPNAKIEGAGIPTGTYITTILTSTTVQMSAAATAGGTGSMVFYVWGNGNGSTTFNLPNLSRNVPVGANGTTGTTTLGGYLGQSGGEATHTLALNEMPDHTHSVFNQLVQATPTTGVIHGAAGYSLQTLTSGGVSGIGTQTAFNVIQPSVNLWAYIKY